MAPFYSDKQFYIEYELEERINSQDLLEFKFNLEDAVMQGHGLAFRSLPEVKNQFWLYYNTDELKHDMVQFLLSDAAFVDKTGFDSAAMLNEIFAYYYRQDPID